METKINLKFFKILAQFYCCDSAKKDILNLSNFRKKQNHYLNLKYIFFSQGIYCWIAYKTVKSQESKKDYAFYEIND